MKVSEDKEVKESLTSLEIQVDSDGEVHSFADGSERWIFMNPISLVDLVKTYKGVLTNVVMELKSSKETSPKSSSGRFFNRR
jgi:hypothetical protein